MHQKKISSFSAFYILFGLSLILWQFYSIGQEMYTISASNQLFEEREAEILLLQQKKLEKEKTLKIRSTKEYADRFQKENYDVYQKGEIVLILPPQEKKDDEFENLSPLEIEFELQKRKPIPEQWKNVFFKNR